jgi:hypothetical protein
MPEYESLTAAQLKIAEQKVILNWYKSRIRAISRRAKIEAAESTAEIEANAIF